ncbi:MAG: alpha/beta hydrolase [Candidatus Krumholzibacteria bacterium]|nr:alpha/beta hydrolase [Candidatus Krumholzibacteria bacterium]MDH4336906.1 alpha/beta hydrolase [Candidatus Krumholzibacteria bacterium]MDH5269798.1 alpha/beta hydrolase [Candidatus Krumholzibacteria bacterium]MDH5628182.1 alpha/beta hydrolase [Candidatus Krumholzibacteria bacterium]
MHAKINGTTIHFVETGETQSPTVLFVHAFPLSSAMWGAQMEAAGHSHRCIAYDIRGLGHSEVGDGQYTIEGGVDDLIALLDYLDIERVVAVGLSMGGYITLRALARNPERFQAAVLCDTRSEADDDAGKIGRANAAAAVKRDGADVFAESFLPTVFAPESFHTRPRAIEHARHIVGMTSPLAIAGHLIAMAGRTDTTGSLASIAVPTLILVGENDTRTPHASSRAMHERIPASELHVVPGAGHMSNMENPAFFNARLVDFLKAQG